MSQQKRLLALRCKPTKTGSMRTTEGFASNIYRGRARERCVQCRMADGDGGGMAGGIYSISSPCQRLSVDSDMTRHRRQGLHSQADPEKMHQAAKNSHFHHLTKAFAGFFRRKTVYF